MECIKPLYRFGLFVVCLFWTNSEVALLMLQYSCNKQYSILDYPGFDIPAVADNQCLTVDVSHFAQWKFQFKKN